jgi:hypothetical protein
MSARTILGDNLVTAAKIYYTDISWFTIFISVSFLEKRLCMWEERQAQELFEIVKNWKQPKCPTEGDWLKKKTIGHYTGLHSGVDQEMR